MEQILNEAIIIAALLIPIVSGLTEVMKHSLPKANEHPKAVSLLTGIVLGLLIAIGFGQDISDMILSGVIAGLAASGLYDNLKDVTK